VAHEKTKKTVSVFRQKKFLGAYSQSPTFNISDCCKTAGIGRRTFYNWIGDDSQFKAAFEELNESRLDAIESALHSRAVADKDTTALIFLAKTLLKNRGYIEGNKISVDGTNPVVRDVIDELIAGTTTVDMAALKITREGIPLPKTLEILLAKQEVKEPESVLPCVTPEELDRKFQEAMAHRDEQVAKFLPLRAAEVIALKEELKGNDSFKPGE
jgi:hypothetical protein